MIEDLTDREISIKITFDSPELISLSDQNIRDRLVFGVVTPLKGKNGLEMSSEGFDFEDGELKAMNDIQPMVNEESTEVQALDGASQGIFNVGFAIMVGQFLLTYIASTTLSFFWTLINSQINFIYLPLLSVNAPG